MNTTVLASTRKLKIGYKDNVLQSGITLNLYGGEMVCLIGPNGCGKSTLIRTLGGLQPALSGHIEINGEKLSKIGHKDRARIISFVLTDRSASDSLTVRQTVEMGRMPYTNMFGTLQPRDKEACAAAMEKTGVAHLAERRIGEISDGERQRAFIAKALAQDTPIIFLDEPCAHLDLPNKIAIMCLLGALARESGKAILMSSHELELALQAADKVWLMSKNGIERGVPEDLILEGKIAAVFNTDKCIFDPSIGGFKINYKEGTKPVSIEADPDNPITAYTRRALERSGFKITPEEELLKITIDNRPSWTLQRNGNNTKYGSLEDLMSEM